MVVKSRSEVDSDPQLAANQNANGMGGVGGRCKKNSTLNSH